MNPFDLPGPQFLLFYIIFSGAVIGALIIWRRYVESSKTPKIDLSDPYLIAYLRGGEAEVLRVATVSLIDRGLLVATGTSLKRAENASPESARRPIEQALLTKYARAGEVSWMFEDDGLKKACEAYGVILRRAQLLADENVTQARLIRLVIAAFLLSGVGFTKVLIAIDAGRTNVGFLIVLTIVAIVVAAVVSFPRLTQSGKEMIEDVQNLYGGLRDRSRSIAPGGATIEPMMLAAAFGVGALHGQAFAYTGTLFPRARKTSNSCASDGDCGSSCSSSSCSSSSSSSCGSSCGGGGGGGCGGCGG
jgi:uncharacterized protein (TIGR04222 family)